MIQTNIINTTIKHNININSANYNVNIDLNKVPTLSSRTKEIINHVNGSKIRELETELSTLPNGKVSHLEQIKNKLIKEKNVRTSKIIAASVWTAIAVALLVVPIILGSLFFGPAGAVLGCMIGLAISTLVCIPNYSHQCADIIDTRDDLGKDWDSSRRLTHWLVSIPGIFVVPLYAAITGVSRYKEVQEYLQLELDQSILSCKRANEGLLPQALQFYKNNQLALTQLYQKLEQHIKEQEDALRSRSANSNAPADNDKYIQECKESLKQLKEVEEFYTKLELKLSQPL